MQRKAERQASMALTEKEIRELREVSHHLFCISASKVSISNDAEALQWGLTAYLMHGNPTVHGDIPPHT